ncbi:MAG: flagellar basal body-associated FliL family protein [Pseudomonadota bacterium]|nr:flagellar basal body-associated FliL family protein [Pseudomonadota bacterium]
MSKEAAPPAEGEAPKKKSKLLIIIIAVVAVVLIGGGAGAYLLLSKPATEKHAKVDHGDEEVAADGEEDGGEQEDEHPPVYERLEQFTVNLADAPILQTDIQLLVADTKVQDKIKARMPEVRDALILLLSSKTAEELALPEGKAKLAQEVQKAVNDVLGVKKKSKGVKKVLFAHFIVQ